MWRAALERSRSNYEHRLFGFGWSDHSLECLNVLEWYCLQDFLSFLALISLSCYLYHWNLANWLWIWLFVVRSWSLCCLGLVYHICLGPMNKVHYLRSARCCDVGLHWSALLKCERKTSPWLAILSFLKLLVHVHITWIIDHPSYIAVSFLFCCCPFSRLQPMSGFDRKL